MVARNKLFNAPPYAVEDALKTLGQNLRIARIRRSQTIGQVAQKIGTGVRAVADAEKGKPSTSVAVYLSILWIYDMLTPVTQLADPNRDGEGQLLSLSKEGVRARKRKGLNNDF